MCEAVVPNKWPLAQSDDIWKHKSSSEKHGPPLQLTPKCRLAGSLKDKIRPKRCALISGVADNSGEKETEVVVLLSGVSLLLPVFYPLLLGPATRGHQPFA